MVNINGLDIKAAYSEGMPIKSIFSLGVKVWPKDEPIDWGGMKLTALEDGVIGIVNNGTNADTTKPSLSYSKDGRNWTEWDYSDIEVSANDVVCFKGINDRIGHEETATSRFTMTAKCNVSGNIMSLLYGDDFEGKNDLTGKDYVFAYLFSECNIVDAEYLILPSLVVPAYGYDHMLFSNSNLIAAPMLPATTVGERGYWSLFQGTNIEVYKYDLPATSLADNSYRSMFNNCKSLRIFAGDILADTMSTRCCDYMFSGCTALEEAPGLRATTLDNYCYEYMFSGCTSLTTAPYLPATTLKSNCYRYMFQNCSSLNYVKANFTTKPSTAYSNSWLSGVSATGTFVANPSASWPSSITKGVSTVPTGWNIVTE